MLGLTDNVIVICHGKMTKKQRVIARKNATVRTDKLLEAVEWLCENNLSWKEEVDARERSGTPSEALNIRNNLAINTIVSSVLFHSF